MSEKAPSGKDAAKGCLLILFLLAVVGGVAAIVVFSLRAGGDDVARLTVSEAPSSASFRIEAPSEVTLWTDLDVTHRDISTQSSNDELPHVVDYVVTVTRDGAKVADLRCNPFDSNVMRRSGKHTAMGSPEGRFYDGRLNGCAFDAEPGTYAITARSQRVAEDARIVFRKSELVVRANEK